MTWHHTLRHLHGLPLGFAITLLSLAAVAVVVIAVIAVIAWVTRTKPIAQGDRAYEYREVGFAVDREHIS